MHRIIKAMGLKQLEQLAPDRYDGRKVDAQIMTQALGIEDPEEYFAPPAAPGALPPDPTLAVANLVAQTEQAKVAQKEAADQRAAQIKAAELTLKAKIEAEKLAGTRTVTEIKEAGAMERELVKLEGQAALKGADHEHAAAESDLDRAQAHEDREAAAEQSELDREHQRAESDAGRQNAVQLAKMKPKPTTGGKK
jgi:hypothetical protein